jgi:hypothetical protein
LGDGPGSGVGADMSLLASILSKIL